VSTPRELERQYLTTVSGWIVSLPHDLKILFEAKDDPNLEREAREIAAGAILYALNPDTSGDDNFVGFADDAIMLRAALRAVIARGGEGAPDFRQRFTEYYDSLDENLELCQKAMGDTFTWLLSKLENLHKQVYKGKKVPIYLDDDESVELLYEDGLAFATDYPIDEDKLSMRLKKPETLLEPLRRRAAEEKKKIA
jgi:hypothetical protein